MAISTKPPTGTRDFLPDAVAERRYVIGIIESVYRQFGFLPLETPAIENLTTLLGKYGEEGDQLIFRLLHRGEKLKRVLASDEIPDEGRLGDLGLRYDLTVPLARVVAQHGSKLPRFLRRYQIQPVWRADRPGGGRYREFFQCDADVIGSTSMIVEAELLGAVSAIFSRLKFQDAVIRLNHRGVLSALMRAAGVAAELEGSALVAIDKLDKVGPAGVLGELEGRGLVPSVRERLEPLLARYHDAELESAPEGAMELGFVESRIGDDEAGRAAVEELRELLALCDHNAAGARLRVDPCLARGLTYYTGPIFEVAVPDLAGSLGGGGRYDGLIGMFQGRQIPACGVSLGLERILVVMGERAMFPPLSEGPQVLVTLWSEELGPASVGLAGALRQAGLAVELYPEPAKPGKQLKYAAQRQVPVVALLAPSEVERGTVQLKDLRAGSQVEVPLREVGARAAALVGKE